MDTRPILIYNIAIYEAFTPRMERIKILDNAPADAHPYKRLFYTIVGKMTYDLKDHCDNFRNWLKRLDIQYMDMSNEVLWSFVGLFFQDTGTPIPNPISLFFNGSVPREYIDIFCKIIKHNGATEWAAFLASGRQYSYSLSVVDSKVCVHNWLGPLV